MSLEPKLYSVIVTRGADEFMRTQVQVRPSTSKDRPTVDRVRAKYVQSEDQVSFKSCAHRQRVAYQREQIGRAPCDGAEDRGVRRRAELLFVDPGRFPALCDGTAVSCTAPSRVPRSDGTGTRVCAVAQLSSGTGFVGLSFGPGAWVPGLPSSVGL